MDEHNIHPVLEAALKSWVDASALRTRRERFKAFTYGRQWGDMIKLPGGLTVTEGEYASQTGRIPMTNNLIRQMVKTVTGRFRMDSDKLRGDSSWPANPELESARMANSLDELDARMLEEFLISGCAVQRVVREKRPGRPGVQVYVDNVSPSRFFVNRFKDPRGWDIELVGMLHEMSVTEGVMRFGHCNPARCHKIASKLSAGDAIAAPEGFFDAPPGKICIAEVWTLESVNVLRCHDTKTGEYYLTEASQQPVVERINGARLSRGESRIATRCEATLRWRYRFFAPDGSVLDEGLSPYAHGSHPFVVKFFPLTDGEVHSMVEDVIDQQRHVNRLITLIDHIMSHSAKGVLLFPASAKIKDMTWEDVAREWTRVNGLLPYSPNGSDCKPEQVVNGGTDAGAHKLLELEMRLIERISGVNESVRGEMAAGNGGSALYESRLENSTVALADTYASFRNFLALRDEKILTA